MKHNPFEKYVGQDIGTSETPQYANPFEKLAAEESKIHPAKSIVQQWGRKFLSEAAASPRTLAEGISGLSELAAQKGVEQQIKAGEVPEEDKFTENVLKTLSFPKRILEKFWPNAEEAERGLKTAFEFLGSEQTPIEPQTSGQERAANIGSFMGGSVLGGPKKLLERLALGAGAGAGSQIAKEAGGGLGSQLIGAIGLPAFISLAHQISTGKWTPKGSELQALKKFGEGLGLTEEELTPILQSEAKIATLGKVATGTSKSAKALESAEEKLSQSYKTLKEDAKSFPGLAASQKNKMLQSFDDIVTRLKQSALPPDEKLKVIQKIEGAMSHFGANGIDAPSIIETWHDINKTVNWNAYAGGKKDLVALKEPLKEALETISPEIAERFDKINSLWGRMKNIGSKITDKDMKKWVDYGESFALLGSLVNAVLTGNWGPVKTAIGTVAARRLANKMLTDPKYQELYTRSVNAIKSSNKAQGLKLIKEFDLETDQPEQK